jgi:hypothetical protein
LSLHSFDLCDLPIGVFFKTLSSQPGRLAQGPLEKFGFDGLLDGLTKVIVIQYQLSQVIHKQNYFQSIYPYFFYIYFLVLKKIILFSYNSF